MSAIAAAVIGGVATAYSAHKAGQAADRAADSQDYYAQLTYDLGQDQLAFEREKYEAYKPYQEQIAQGLIASQAQQMEQAGDYYDYQKETFRPLEMGLVQQAQEFDTDAYRKQLAAKAAAASGRAFTSTQGALGRSMASMGVSPASGRYAGAANRAALTQAATRAGAMTQAGQQAEQMGWARKMDVTGLGRNLAGASTGAYAGATSAGGTGANVLGQIGAGYSGAMSGVAGAMAGLSGQYGSQYGQFFGEQMGTIGSGVGMIGQLGAGYLGGQYGQPTSTFNPNTVLP